MTANKHSRIASCLLQVLMIAALSLLAHSQQLPAGAATTGSSAAGVSPTDTALPASQIIELLNQKPELMVDLKRLAAEQLQAQGLNVQEDSITDEMLLGKIVSDASVRANITLWLEARGYVTAADVEQARAQNPSSDDEDNLSTSGTNTRLAGSSDAALSQLLASGGDLTNAENASSLSSDDLTGAGTLASNGIAAGEQAHLALNEAEHYPDNRHCKS